MIISIVSITGVAIASTYGFTCIMRAAKGQAIYAGQIILFGIGVAMATCSLFIK